MKNVYVFIGWQICFWNYSTNLFVIKARCSWHRYCCNCHPAVHVHRVKCSVNSCNGWIRSKNRRCTRSVSDATVVTVNYVKRINLPVTCNKSSSQTSVKLAPACYWNYSSTRAFIATYNRIERNGSASCKLVHKLVLLISTSIRMALKRSTYDADQWLSAWSTGLGKW